MKPVVDRKFQLEEIIEAETYLHEGKHFGKVLIEIF
ncbi:MAG: hypothetical protein ACFE8G_14420 [Candidatus Hermodarchaeota archaeon]